MSASDRKEESIQVKEESIIPRAYTGAPAPRPAPLSPEQEKAYGIVLERFGSEEYRTVSSNESGKEGEGEALMAQERFWLVTCCGVLSCPFEIWDCGLTLSSRLGFIFCVIYDYMM